MRKLRGVQGFGPNILPKLTEEINYWVDKTESEFSQKGWGFSMVDVKFLDGPRDEQGQDNVLTFHAVCIYEVVYP